MPAPASSPPTSPATHPALTPLLGAWRLQSMGMTFADTGERIEPFGPTPTGRMILAPSGHIMFIFTKPNRHPPTTDAERALLFTESMAYSGTARPDGTHPDGRGRLITTIDISLNPAWSGDQLRLYTLTGDHLTIGTLPQTAPRFPARLFVGDVVFVRE